MNNRNSGMGTSVPAHIHICSPYVGGGKESNMAPQSNSNVFHSGNGGFDGNEVNVRLLSDNTGGMYEEHTVPEGTSLSSLLDDKFTPGQEFIVQLNGQDPADDHVLAEGDCITAYSSKKDGA